MIAWELDSRRPTLTELPEMAAREIATSAAETDGQLLNQTRRLCGLDLATR